MLFTPYKAVILSEAPRGSIAQRTAYGAQSKDPGDACWQMLFRAFQPQTTGQIKKATSSDRSEAKRRDLQFPSPSTTYKGTPLLSHQPLLLSVDRASTSVVT